MNGCTLPYTQIAVDFWKIRQCSRVRLFFLSHVHVEQSSSLTASWSLPIYCSPISKQLLLRQFPLDPNVIHELELNRRHVIPLTPTSATEDGGSNEGKGGGEGGAGGGGGSDMMSVTLIDANHCPGAVMFLFEGYFGRILYTGDFRYNDEMIQSPLFLDFVSRPVDVLYLDNTFCSPKCTHPSRSEAMTQIIDIIARHPNEKILIGLRHFGKEGLLDCIAKHFEVNIAVGEQRYKTLELLRSTNHFRMITSSSPDSSSISSDCRIEVVPFQNITRSNLESWNKERPTIAILPTALFIGLGYNPLASCRDIYVVPYSDHSSYSELHQFVCAVRPKSVIPIVKADIRDPLHPSLLERTSVECFQEYLDRTPMQNYHIPPAILELMNQTTSLSPVTGPTQGRRTSSGGAVKSPRGSRARRSATERTRVPVVSQTQKDSDNVSTVTPAAVVANNPKDFLRRVGSGVVKIVHQIPTSVVRPIIHPPTQPLVKDRLAEPLLNQLQLASVLAAVKNRTKRADTVDSPVVCSVRETNSIGLSTECSSQGSNEVTMIDQSNSRSSEDSAMIGSYIPYNNVVQEHVPDSSNVATAPLDLSVQQSVPASIMYLQRIQRTSELCMPNDVQQTQSRREGLKSVFENSLVLLDGLRDCDRRFSREVKSERMSNESVDQSALANGAIVERNIIRNLENISVDHKDIDQKYVDHKDVDQKFVDQKYLDQKHLDHKNAYDMGVNDNKGTIKYSDFGNSNKDEEVDCKDSDKFHGISETRNVRHDDDDDVSRTRNERHDDVNRTINVGHVPHHQLLSSINYWSTLAPGFNVGSQMVTPGHPMMTPGHPRLTQLLPNDIYSPVYFNNDVQLVCNISDYQHSVDRNQSYEVIITPRHLSGLEVSYTENESGRHPSSGYTEVGAGQHLGSELRYSEGRPEQLLGSGAGYTEVEPEQQLVAVAGQLSLVYTEVVTEPQLGSAAGCSDDALGQQSGAGQLSDSVAGQLCSSEIQYTEDEQEAESRRCSNLQREFEEFLVKSSSESLTKTINPELAGSSCDIQSLGSIWMAPSFILTQDKNMEENPIVSQAQTSSDITSLFSPNPSDASKLNCGVASMVVAPTEKHLNPKKKWRRRYGQLNKSHQENQLLPQAANGNGSESMEAGRRCGLAPQAVIRRPSNAVGGANNRTRTTQLAVVNQLPVGSAVGSSSSVSHLDHTSFVRTKRSESSQPGLSNRPSLPNDSSRFSLSSSSLLHPLPPTVPGPITADVRARATGHVNTSSANAMSVVGTSDGIYSRSSDVSSLSRLTDVESVSGVVVSKEKSAASSLTAQLFKRSSIVTRLRMLDGDVVGGNSLSANRKRKASGGSRLLIALPPLPPLFKGTVVPINRNDSLSSSLHNHPLDLSVHGGEGT